MEIEFGVGVVESGGNCFAVDAVEAKRLANLDASPKVESHLVVDESVSEARVVDKCVVVEKVDNAVGILTRQSPTSHLFSEFAGRVFGAGASGYTVEFADGNNVAVSVEYDKDNKNVLLFVAEKGYSIDKLTVAGKKGGADKTIAISDFNAVPSGISVSLVKNADGTVKQATVSLALDEFDGVATASYVSSPLKFNLTVRYGTDGNDGQGGTVTGAGVVYYGKTASVSVGAEQNY